MTGPDDALPAPGEVLAHYDIEPVTRVASAGGTAGRTWRVTTRERAYFLRLRGVRTSTPERLAYDHGLRRHLTDQGVPTAEALCTTDGQRWLTLAGRVYELYPFAEGRPFDWDSTWAVAAAARALARFHLAARDYEPPDASPIEIAQYAWLGFCEETSQRMDDPKLQVANVEAILDISQTEEERAASAWALVTV